jgi:serine/threonine protein kinase
MSQKSIKTLEGTYGIIKQTKTASIVKKIYKHGDLYFTTIKEIAVYRAISAYGHEDLFVKIYRIKPNKIYMEKYDDNLNNVNFKVMPMCDKLKIIGSLIKAMSALHSMMIIHGDIKPENIMINSPDDVKIIDFGLANLGQYSPETCTNQSHEIYTWLWRAPEIHAKSRYNMKADIWALAIVFLRIIIFVAEDSYIPTLNKLFSQIKSLPKNDQLLATKNILKGLFTRDNDLGRFAHLHNAPELFDLIVHMLVPNHEWRYDIITISEKFALIEKEFSEIETNVPNTLIPSGIPPGIPSGIPPRITHEYSNRKERFFELQKIYHIGQDNNLSYQIIMHSFILYDMIYCKCPDFQQLGIEFSCIYISCALYYNSRSGIFGGGILAKDGIIKILQLLDYNIYTKNYVDDLVKSYGNISIEQRISTLLKNYINRKELFS